MPNIPPFDIKVEQDKIVKYLKSYFDTAKISLEYPAQKASMPYITVAMRTNPLKYSLNYSEVYTLATVEISVWESTITKTLDIVTELGNVMRFIGFGRTSQTKVEKDGTIGKFFKREIYRANYNALTNKYELRQ